MYRKCLRRGKVSHKSLTDGVWYIWELATKFISIVFCWFGFLGFFLFSPVKIRQFKECLEARLLYLALSNHSYIILLTSAKLLSSHE